MATLKRRVEKLEDARQKRYTEISQRLFGTLTNQERMGLIEGIEAYVAGEWGDLPEEKQDLAIQAMAKMKAKATPEEWAFLGGRG